MSDTLVFDHFSTVDQAILTVLTTTSIKLPQPTLDSSQYFFKLCDDIVSQQLAGKAADAIFKRFVALFPDGEVTAERLLEIPDQAVRDIGASWAKVRYLKDLAAKTQAGELRYDQLSEMTDEQVITELSQVKGIGRWTAEMFLIFTLGREDVFSFGDLGLKNGFKKLYSVTTQDPKLLKQEMEEITARWSPYRSYGSLALWRHLDNR
jgi:DNA-3-methyladenine glycosylase II